MKTMPSETLTVPGTVSHENFDEYTYMGNNQSQISLMPATNRD